MVANPATEFHNTPNKSIRMNVPRKGVVLHHAAMTNYDALLRLEMGAKQVSSTDIVKDARVGQMMPLDVYRAWSLSDAYWDSALRSVETCNESSEGWTISEASHRSLAKLVAFFALRDGFWPHRDGDPKKWTVLGHREVYTIHGGSYATSCPGGMDLNKVTRYAQELLRQINPEPDNEEEELMSASSDIINAVGNMLRRESRGRVVYDAGPHGNLGFGDAKVTRAAIVRSGKVQPLPADPNMRLAKVNLWRDSPRGMLIAPKIEPHSLGEQPQPMTSTEFHEYVDFNTDNDDPIRPFGRFVRNLFDVEVGMTQMERFLPDSNRTYFLDYANAAAVWQNGFPVELLKGGQKFLPGTHDGAKVAIYANGSYEPLTDEEVDGADYQRIGGQDWSRVV